MKPKGGLNIISLCVLSVLSCTGGRDPQVCVSLNFTFHSAALRAADPPQMLISDYNLLIYDSFGVLEEKVYVPRRSYGAASHSVTLLRGEKYTVLAAANLGYELEAPLKLEDALESRFYLAYPDEYPGGIPMSAKREFTASDTAVDVLLERLMARIDVRLDLSSLDPGVNLVPRKICVGSCPRAAALFLESAPEEFFPEGFSRSGRELDGMGDGVSMYMLENVLGSSYVELFFSYYSESYSTGAGESLVYRFSLGPVLRNSVYEVCVAPKGSGLGDGSDGWRIDRGGLAATKAFDLHPAAYNECRVTDDFHLWCDVLPRDTPMTIEALAYDEDERVADIYGYTVDDDGYGITIHPRKSGSAVVYFSTGEPLCRDTLAMVVILP